MNSPQVGRLEGRVAIVTGGAGGIGLAIAKAFRREGAIVVIADPGATLDGEGRSAEALSVAQSELDGIRGGGWSSPTDVTDPRQVQQLIETTAAKAGRLDIVVNAAGVLRTKDLWDCTSADWNRVVETNLTGVFHVTRAAALHWRSAGGGGRLINIASDAGLYGSPDAVAYAASKAGVIAFTLSCVSALDRIGVTCNVVHPQAKTRMTAALDRTRLPDSDRWETDEFDADHVTPAVVYLASEQAGHVTGEILASYGYEVHGYSPAHRSHSIFSDGPWDLDALFRRMDEIVAQPRG